MKKLVFAALAALVLAFSAVPVAGPANAAVHAYGESHNPADGGNG